MEILDLAQLEFASTTLFHYIFVPLTPGFSLIVAVMQTQYYRTGDEHYKKRTKFRGKLFLINFGMGFVMTLPDGYDTHVGENGVALSGGERQRVALARVILKDAPIWILDEATANLDAQTEYAVMQSIYEAAGTPRTLLLITHRLPLLRDIERVIHMP